MRAEASIGEELRDACKLSAEGSIEKVKQYY
jgi:hypothetical protein